MKETKENMRGITLIALVVTIIILLILSGITINMLLGENGIIRTAQEAKNTWEGSISNEQESIQNLVNELNEIMNEDGGTEKKSVKRKHTPPSRGNCHSENPGGRPSGQSGTGSAGKAESAWKSIRPRRRKGGLGDGRDGRKMAGRTGRGVAGKGAGGDKVRPWEGRTSPVCDDGVRSSRAG